MVGIIEPDGDEVARCADARADARIAAHQRQLVDLGLGDPGEPFGVERIAGDVRHHLGEIADAALGVEDSRFLAAGRAEADELHYGSPIRLLVVAQVAGSAIMRRVRILRKLWRMVAAAQFAPAAILRDAARSARLLRMRAGAGTLTHPESLTEKELSDFSPL